MVAETITAYKCLKYDAISEETSKEPLYECFNCGTKFNRANSAEGESHRCPTCGKFGSKLSDDSYSDNNSTI